LSEPEVILVRHGETAWSRSGQHTSRTDLDLTPDGERRAVQIGRVLAGWDFDLVLSSPRLRALRTAELAGLGPIQVEEGLAEWDYGELEGLTSSQIEDRYPGWTVWDGPWPAGESAAEVAGRADGVIDAMLDAGATRIAVVGHGHFSRVLAARWVGQDLRLASQLLLDTATWSDLGWFRGMRVLRHWNVPPGDELAAPDEDDQG
jgi:broad specificity phosphatase PhoE